MAPGVIWEVTGGADKGGIVVRSACDLDSQAFENRLATGARIKELDMKGQRLNYKLLTGTGPSEGWVSVALKGQPLVTPHNPNAPNRESMWGLDKMLLRHQSKGTVADCYDFQKDIGEGGYASVTLAKNKQTGKMYAVKRLPYKKEADLIQIDAEFRVLTRLDHPHIIKIFEFFREPATIYLVTELCTGGSFREFFRDAMWDLEDARLLFWQVISAIHHCHKMKVLHHDLKPENCLILKETGRPFAKIIDFGIAVILQSDASKEAAEDLEIISMTGGSSQPHQTDEDTVSQVTGTPWWRAPEVLDTNRKSGPKADMYSMGVMMFLCLTGTHPLHHGSWCEPMGAKETMEIYDDLAEECLGDADIPDEAEELILHLLAYNKDERLDARQALDHAWFENPFQEAPSTPKGLTANRISFAGLSDISSPPLSPKMSPMNSPRHSSVIESVPEDRPVSPSRRLKINSGLRRQSSRISCVPEAVPESEPISPLPVTCKAGHELKEYITEEDDWSCSICTKDFPEGTLLRCCRKCDYDVCGACFDTLKAEKEKAAREKAAATDRPASPSSRGRRRVRLGVEIPQSTVESPKLTAEALSNARRQMSPESPRRKLNKFRVTRQRRGSVKSAMLLNRVLRYKELDIWHHAILRLIAHNSHESEVSKQRERFNELDTDRSGSVDRDKLAAGMSKHGMMTTQDEIDGIFLALDSKGTGEIEYKEWIAATLRADILVQEEVMTMVFSFFDTKGTGIVGFQELKAVLGADQAQRVLQRAEVAAFTWDSFMEFMAQAVYF